MTRDELIAAYYASGEKVLWITERFHISGATLTRIIHDAGLRLRRIEKGRKRSKRQAAYDKRQIRLARRCGLSSQKWHRDHAAQPCSGGPNTCHPSNSSSANSNSALPSGP